MQPQYLRNDVYQNQSPLFHVGSYMKKTLDNNDQVSERLLSLVFKNISNKEVIAIQGIIHNYNPFNESLGETPFTLIEIPTFKPGTLYGETVFFKVHNEAVLFKVELKRITYHGFETQNLELETYEKIERQEVVDQLNKKEYILNKYQQGIDYIRDLKIGKSYYHCVCGAMNHLDNVTCIQCQASKETYLKRFKEENIEKEIESDALAFQQSLFQQSGLSLDMTDEAIEKQVASHGYEKVVNKVKEEKERYQKLNEVIKNKVPYFILFDTLISKIESIQKRIEKTKEEELRKEKKIQKDKKLSKIIQLISKDIESGSFKININNYNEDLVNLKDDLKRLKFLYFFSSKNLDMIKIKLMEYIDSGEGIKRIIDNLDLFKENLVISKTKHFDETIHLEFDKDFANMIDDILIIKKHLMIIHKKLEINNISELVKSFNENIIKLGFFNTWDKSYNSEYFISNYRDLKFINKIDKSKLKSEKIKDFVDTKQNMFNKFLDESSKVVDELNTYIKRAKINYFLSLGLSIIPGLFLAIGGLTNTFIEYILIQAFLVGFVIIVTSLRFESKMKYISNGSLKECS